MKIIKKDGNTYTIGNWYIGWKSKGFEITYHTSGYEDGRHFIDITMFGWYNRFYLPFMSKKYDYWDWENEHTYGINSYYGTLYLLWGKYQKSWDLPFVTGKTCRWERYKGPSQFIDKRENFEIHPYKTKYKGGCTNPTVWTYDYIDPTDKEIIPCRFWVEEMEWRPKWLGWTKLFAKTRRFIEIEFSKEACPRKGSWKGGTIGMMYDMLSTEHPMDTIHRFQQDYKFG